MTDKLKSTFSAFDKCTSFNDLEQALSIVIKSFGFVGFELLDISHYQVNHGNTLEQNYQSLSLKDLSPNFSKAQCIELPSGRAGLPLTIDSLGGEETQKGKELQSENGVIIPYHFVDPDGRIYSNLIRFQLQENNLEAEKITREEKIDLHILMVYWAQCAMDLTVRTFGEINQNRKVN